LKNYFDIFEIFVTVIEGIDLFAGSRRVVSEPLAASMPLFLYNKSVV
jgi:hypothetical protein